MTPTFAPSCASRARHRSLRSCRCRSAPTLQTCGGNKTRAAALLGVSLKTLYNRLNAYRAQGLVMDYAAIAGRDIEITGLHADLTGELTEAL